MSTVKIFTNNSQPCKQVDDGSVIPIFSIQHLYSTPTRIIFRYNNGDGDITSDQTLQVNGQTITGTMYEKWNVLQSYLNPFFLEAPDKGGMIHEYIKDPYPRTDLVDLGYNGTVRYVATNGNDSNNGLTVGSPKKTITSAYNASSQGDVIQLADGTYDVAQEENGYLLLNTHGKGVLIRGNTNDRNAVKMIQSDGSKLYCVRMRDCGSIALDSIVMNVGANAVAVYIDYNETYLNLSCTIKNSTIISLNTQQAIALAGQTTSGTSPYLIQANKCSINSVGRFFNHVGSNAFTKLVVINCDATVTGEPFLYNYSGSGKTIAYGNRVNVLANTYAMTNGADGVPSVVAIGEVDFRDNKITYANGYYGHGILLGGGCKKAKAINNYIYQPYNSSSLDIGIVVKTISDNLGDVVISGNYVYSPRPFLLKGCKLVLANYNTWVANNPTLFGSFNFTNVLDSGTDYLTTGNVIEGNNIIADAAAIQAYGGVASESETITMKKNTFRNNNYYSGNGKYVEVTEGTTYDFEHMPDYFGANNNTGAKKIYSTQLPVKVLTS